MEREEGWTGNQPKYEGFVPDLLRDLEEHLGVKFKVILSPDNRFGDRQSDGHWDGMVGQLIRKVKENLGLPIFFVLLGLITNFTCKSVCFYQSTDDISENPLLRGT